MNYQVKLKSGFFKTLKYKMTVEEDELILKPELREGFDLIAIRNEDVLELGFIRYPGGKLEFEIITTGAYYFGYISPDNDTEELIRVLKNSFGKRLSVE